MDSQSRLEERTKQLEGFVYQMDKSILVPLMVLLLQIDRGTQNRILGPLLSPVKQIGYLLSLSLSSTGKRVPNIDDIKFILLLLSDIEVLYKKIQTLSEDCSYYDDNYKQVLCVNAQYSNCFFSGELIYKEQVIDRIRKIFGPINTCLEEEKGISIEDCITFFLETIRLNKDNVQEAANKYKCLDLLNENDSNSYEKKFYLPDENILRNLSFKIEDYTTLSHDKLCKFLSIFSTSATNNTDLRYYGAEQEVETNPIIKVLPDQYILYDENQLSVAIFDMLSKSLELNKYSKLRAEYLENKAKNIFERFYDEKRKIYTKYYINGGDKEKDLLVIYNKIAFVVECKSDIKKEAFRDIKKAYNRIKQDFKTVIQKAYSQAHEVKQTLLSDDFLNITDKNGNIKANIDCSNISSVYEILITQERYGFYQIDLGVLLDKEKNDVFPWSVSIDDFETLMLTLKRCSKPHISFIQYLDLRQKLNKKVIANDELDIAACYFIDKRIFIRKCYENNIWIVKQSNCFFFDNLYKFGGLGFENEINMSSKFLFSSLFMKEYNKCRKIHLKCSQNANQYIIRHNLRINKIFEYIDKSLMRKNEKEQMKRFLLYYKTHVIEMGKVISEFEQKWLHK